MTKDEYIQFVADEIDRRTQDRTIGGGALFDLDHIDGTTRLHVGSPWMNDPMPWKAQVDGQEAYYADSYDEIRKEAIKAVEDYIDTFDSFDEFWEQATEHGGNPELVNCIISGLQDKPEDKEEPVEFCFSDVPGIGNGTAQNIEDFMEENGLTGYRQLLYCDLTTIDRMGQKTAKRLRKKIAKGSHG